MLENMLYNEEGYDSAKAIASSYGAMISLILTSIMMAIFPWLKRLTLFVWFGLIMVIGVITGIMSPLGAFEGFYGICCAIMTIVAQMLGWTYLETCCFENIYIHSLLPTLFAIPAVYVGFRNIRRGIWKSLSVSSISAINFIICASVTTIVWNHYINLSMVQASQLCVKELQILGTLFGVGWFGYVFVNMIIFVGLFLMSAYISWLLYRWTKYYEKTNG